MCDYSLHDVKSRPAKKDDKLMLGTFGQYKVRGFGRPEDGTACVTCVPHGSMLEVTRFGRKPERAIFGHNDNGSWHDGLVFASEPNVVVSLQDLDLGTTATVWALPRVDKPVKQRELVEAHFPRGNI